MYRSRTCFYTQLVDFISCLFASFHTSPHISCPFLDQLEVEEDQEDVPQPPSRTAGKAVVGPGPSGRTRPGIARRPAGNPALNEDVIRQLQVRLWQWGLQLLPVTLLLRFW